MDQHSTGQAGGEGVREGEGFGVACESNQCGVGTGHITDVLRLYLEN